MKQLDTAIKEWLLRLAEDEVYLEGIKVYHFGLLTGEGEGFLFLVGSKEYDESDLGWLKLIDYEPDEKYLPLPPELINGKPAEESLALIIESLDKCFDHPAIEHSFLMKADHLTAGLDEGDLVKLR